VYHFGTSLPLSTILQESFAELWQRLFGLKFLLALLLEAMFSLGQQ
jgi:hypothetical protein